MSFESTARRTGFIRWHERKLFTSFSWLTVCLLGGVVIVTIVEFIILGGGGFILILAVLVCYLVGIGALEAFRRFWRGLSDAQQCANLATCDECHSYGLFDVVENTRPIYARCQKCDHQWVIEY